MAQRKKSFRFRIPRLSAAPESFVRRPKDTSKSPTQSDTNVPIQRPSRPSVITPAESPPSPIKTQEAPPRNEPQNQSPPHITEPITPPSSSVIVETTQSKPPSPSTSPNLVNSSPPSLQQPSASQLHVVSTQSQSPSHYDTMKVPKPSSAEENAHPASSAGAEQKKEKIVTKSEPMSQEPEPEPEMKVNSPLRAIAKSPETYFQPERLSKQPAGFEPQASSMPSLSPVSKTEPTFQPHPPSPLAPEQTNEVLKANHEENTSHASSSSQEEKEKTTVPEPVPQEAEPKMKSPLKIIPKSPQTSSQPTATTLDEERSISTTSKAPLETPSKFIQHEEKKKMVHETKKLGKSKDTSTSQPIQPTKASASGTEDNNKKKHGVQETVERKIMFATSNSSGKDIGVVRNVSSSSISPQRNVPSREEREKAPLQKGIKDDITKFVHKIAASVHPTQPTEDKQLSVITLAGDNRGATMHVGSESDKKEGSIHIHRAYKTDPEESTEVTTDGEGNNTNTEEEEDSMEDSEVGKAYVNSNIQSINNSLMFHGSVNDRDPGVQVTLPQKPLEATKPNDKDTHSHRTEFNISRSQKSTYQPIRGLVHEPSDSDPNKPRPHGCKFRCGKNIEDIEIL